MRLVVSVPEAYTGFLNGKDKVSFSVKALPDRKFTADVHRLAGALDNRLRAERTEMDVYSNDKTLLPGMVAEVDLPLPAMDSAFLVPSSADVKAPTFPLSRKAMSMGPTSRTVALVAKPPR